MARDARDERIEQLERENAELRALVDELRRRLAELEEAAGRNSRNSNKPPSSDNPADREARPNRKRSDRKRGAQPGHTGHRRELVPADRCSSVTDVFPENCTECGAPLPEESDPEPVRHQVAELPPVVPDFREWRLHSRECVDCGHHTRAELPVGVPRGMFGPRLLALIGLLTGILRVSRRNAQTLLSDVFGLEVSLGAISEAEERVSDAVAPAVEEATEFVKSEAVKHVDATGWRQGSADKTSDTAPARTLWTMSTALVTVFTITRDATTQTVRAIVGRVCGILISDRAKQFGFWAMHRRQICWAHLLRKFAGFAQLDGAAGRIGRELFESAQLLFHWWHRVRDGTLTLAEFRRYMAALRPDVEEALEKAVGLDLPRFSGSCDDILKHRAALWTFVDKTGVEPTNNRAERDLRPFVIWRKVSNGSQSDRGTRYAERLMSVAVTLRKQQRHVFAYLHTACASALSSAPPPSLLPATP